ncbi:MAG: tetratricopeptide repeat protein [Sphingomonas sp.]|nr:tetratricopeptide repeat protein [Sphingomonas sp.]
MDPRTEMLLKRAAALRRAGRVDEAIAAYEQLLSADPNLPDSWYNLAWLQRQARRYDQALAAYGEALNRDVRDPEEVHLNRAVILSDHLYRPDEAETELNAALSLKPDYVPALLNLGNLHEDRGNRGAAEAAYRRALAVAPEDALALSRLAAISHSREFDEELAGRVRAAIARPGVTAAEQADLSFALAGLLDAAGQFDEAFEAASAANEASRAATGARYDRAAVERLIDQLIASPPARQASAAAQSPVFILGMYRSGSTLVEQILAGHSRIQPAGELDLVAELASRISGYPQSVGSAEEATIAEWRKFYVNGLPPASGEEVLVTDKRPDNFLHIGLIKTLFPDAKIVHTRRNRLDNLVSLHFLHLSADMAYALDLRDAAHWYAQHERLMAHWKSVYPDDIFEVDYDELVRSPAPVIGCLLAFLGLEWEDSVLDFGRTSRPVKTASVWQVRQPLHGRSSGRWRNYSAMKAIADEAAANQ